MLNQKTQQKQKKKKLEAILKKKKKFNNFAKPKLNFVHFNFILDSKLKKKKKTNH